MPAEWVTELVLEQNAILERTKKGILINPLSRREPECSRVDWDAVFSEKLKIGKQSDLDLLEVSGDDFLF